MRRRTGGVGDGWCARLADVGRRMPARIDALAGLGGVVSAGPGGGGVRSDVAGVPRPVRHGVGAADAGAVQPRRRQRRLAGYLDLARLATGRGGKGARSGTSARNATGVVEAL